MSFYTSTFVGSQRISHLSHRGSAFEHAARKAFRKMLEGAERTRGSQYWPKPDINYVVDGDYAVCILNLVFEDCPPTS